MMPPDRSEHAGFDFNRAFDMVFGVIDEKTHVITGSWSAIRSEAISRFCCLYRSMKYELSDSPDKKPHALVVIQDLDFEANRFSLPWLTQKIQKVERLTMDYPPRYVSRASAYDYAHAMIFLEALRLIDNRFTLSTVSSTSIGKIGDRSFMLSPTMKQKLDRILFARHWTVSEFVEMAIGREYECL